MPTQHSDARFRDPRLPNSLRHMRLEAPQRRVLATRGQHRFKPRRATIVRIDASIKLQRQPAHRRAVSKRLVVDVRAAEPFHAHAAEMLPCLHKHDLLSHRRCLHRCDHTRARAAVDAQIGLCGSSDQG